MNPKYLEKMSASELNEYAKAIGIKKLVGKTRAEKIEYLEKRRHRSATIKVLGVTLNIPIKALHDRRVYEVLDSPTSTDNDCVETLKLVIGEEQFQELLAACTDEDGTVDSDALAYAYAVILHSPELKKY